MEMYKIRFTLGDWSDDGHGQKETFHMKSNYPGSEINKTLQKFESETECDIRSWCEEYEDTYIHEPDTSKLISLGIITSEELTKDRDYECEGTLGYIDLISRIIKHYLPDFEWDHESFEDEEVLYIDECGYGLW